MRPLRKVPRILLLFLEKSAAMRLLSSVSDAMPITPRTLTEGCVGGLPLSRKLCEQFVGGKTRILSLPGPYVLLKQHIYRRPMRAAPLSTMRNSLIESML